MYAFHASTARALKWILFVVVALRFKILTVKSTDLFDQKILSDFVASFHY